MRGNVKARGIRVHPGNRKAVIEKRYSNSIFGAGRRARRDAWHLRSQSFADYVNNQAAGGTALPLPGF